REHDPDALSAVVGKEERVRVRARVAPTLVEGHPGDRRASGRAALPGDHLCAVVVCVVRWDDCGGLPVKRLADREVRTVVPWLRAAALVAGPAEVLDGSQRVGDTVDLLPGVP